MKTSKPEQGKTNRKRKGTKEKAQEIHIDTETHKFVHTENPTKSKEDFTEINSIIDGVITTRNLANEP